MLDRDTYRATALHPETGRPLATITYHTTMSPASVFDRADHWATKVRWMHGLDADPRLLVERIAEATNGPVAVDLFP